MKNEAEEQMIKELIDILRAIKTTRGEYVLIIKPKTHEIFPVLLREDHNTGQKYLPRLDLAKHGLRVIEN